MNTLNRCAWSNEAQTLATCIAAGLPNVMRQYNSWFMERKRTPSWKVSNWIPIGDGSSFRASILSVHTDPYRVWIPKQKATDRLQAPIRGPLEWELFFWIDHSLLFRSEKLIWLKLMQKIALIHSKHHKLLKVWCSSDALSKSDLAGLDCYFNLASPSKWRFTDLPEGWKQPYPMNFTSPFFSTSSLHC